MSIKMDAENKMNIAFVYEEGISSTMKDFNVSLDKVIEGIYKVYTEHIDFAYHPYEAGDYFGYNREIGSDLSEIIKSCTHKEFGHVDSTWAGLYFEIHFYGSVAMKRTLVRLLPSDGHQTQFMDLHSRILAAE